MGRVKNDSNLVVAACVNLRCAPFPLSYLGPGQGAARKVAKERPVPQHDGTEHCRQQRPCERERQYRPDVPPERVLVYGKGRLEADGREEDSKEELLVEVKGEVRDELEDEAAEKADKDAASGLGEEGYLVKSYQLC